MAGELPTGSEADQGKNAKPDAFLAAGPAVIAFKTELIPQEPTDAGGDGLLRAE